MMQIRVRVQGGEITTLGSDSVMSQVDVMNKLMDMYGAAVHYDRASDIYRVEPFIGSKDRRTTYVNLPNGDIKQFFADDDASQKRIHASLENIYGPIVTYDEKTGMYIIGMKERKEQVLYEHALKIYEGCRDNLVNEMKIMIPYPADELESFDYFVVEGRLYEKMCVEDDAIHAEAMLGDICVVNHKEEE